MRMNLIDIIQGIVIQAIGQYGVDGVQAIVRAIVHNTLGFVPFLGPIIERILATVLGG